MNIDADDLVRNCPSASFSGAWPLPVQARMEDLVRRATEQGERTSGRELLAAILCAFDVDDVDLHEVLRSYRTSRVRDVLLTDVEDNVVQIQRRPPGRPSVG